MNTADAKRVLETALICAQDPLRVNDLRKLFDEDVSADTIRVLLEELRQKDIGGLIMLRSTTMEELRNFVGKRTRFVDQKLGKLRIASQSFNRILK
mgnify:CR=1 FL=1